jgi:hypothetical protein
MILTKNINANTDKPAYIQCDESLELDKVQYNGNWYVTLETFQANEELFTDDLYTVEYFTIPTEAVETKTIESIKAEIAQLHTQKYNQLIELLNYVDAWEVNLYATLSTSEYYAEAQALIAWYCTTWETLEELEVTLETEPLEVIDSLPEFVV